MPELRKTAYQKKLSANILENELSDIFDLIKITHQLALNQTYDVAHSPYEKDTDTALFASVSFLREKTANFEEKFYGQGQTTT